MPPSFDSTAAERKRPNRQARTHHTTIDLDAVYHPKPPQSRGLRRVRVGYHPGSTGRSSPRALRRLRVNSASGLYGRKVRSLTLAVRKKAAASRCPLLTVPTSGGGSCSTC